MHDDLKTMVQIYANHEILLDDEDMPSTMIKIPKFNVSDVISGGPATVFPAFEVWKGGAWVTLDHIYISKYLNIVHNDRAYSLPFQEPANTLTIDEALEYCENKGLGWHLMSYLEWAAIALWCKKNSRIPHGNNNTGYDVDYATEKGILLGNYTATGSGPPTWTHNYADGIADLNGNVAEWLSGIRLNAGEINVMEKGVPADAGVLGHAVGSALWKSMNKTTGALQAIGANSMHYNAANATPAGIRLADAVTNATTDANSTTENFEDIASTGSANAAGLLLLKTYGLYPDGTYNADFARIRNNGERFCARGGDYSDLTKAGVFAIDFLNTRLATSAKIGFRCAWCDLS